MHPARFGTCQFQSNGLSSTSSGLALAAHSVRGSLLQTAGDAGSINFAARRKSIRETWKPRFLRYPEIEVHFIAARHPDRGAQVQLDVEQRVYNDIMFLDMPVLLPTRKGSSAEAA
jgi:hypothetical protein